MFQLLFMSFNARKTKVIVSVLKVTNFVSTLLLHLNNFKLLGFFSLDCKIITKVPINKLTASCVKDLGYQTVKKKGEFNIHPTLPPKHDCETQKNG